MATLYVTTNAASGDGSLAAAVAAAQDGDVIACNVNTIGLWGTLYNINLLEALVFTHDVTIEESGGTLKLRSEGTAVTISGADVSMSDVWFTRCGVLNGEPTGNHGYIVSVTNSGSLTLNRSRILACYSANHANGGTIGVVAGSLTLNNCIITGCWAKNGAIFESSETGNTVTINDSTIIGNAPRDIYVPYGSSIAVSNSIYQSALNVPAAAVSNCVVDDPSNIGFVSPPDDTIDTSTWDDELAFDSDLYLTSTSVAKSGHSAASGYDVDYLPRRVNGALGAFEFYDVDYYVNWNGNISAEKGGPYVAPTAEGLSGAVYLEREPYADATGSSGGGLNLSGATITRIICPGFRGYFRDITDTSVNRGAFGTIANPASFVIGKWSFLFVKAPAVVNVDDYILIEATPPETVQSKIYLDNDITVLGDSVYNDWEPLEYYVTTSSHKLEFKGTLPDGLYADVVSTGAELKLNQDIIFKSLVIVKGTVITSGFVSVSDDYDSTEWAGLIVDTAGTITAPILAIDPATDITDLTTDATICDYGAGLTSFNATPDGNDIVFEWTKTDASRAVLIQQNQDGVWTTLAAKAAGTTLTAGDPEDGVECRAFDGVQFFRSAGHEPAGWVAVLSALYGVRYEPTRRE